MYLSVIKKEKGNYMRILQKYRDPLSGKPKDKTIEVIGYDTDYLDKYDDPIAHFKKEVERRNEEERSRMISLLIDPDEKMEADENNLYNIGYGILKRIYKELEIDRFWKNIFKDRKNEYDGEKIFELLVFARIINPGSKKYTFDNRAFLFEEYDFEYEDVMHALDIYGKYERQLQKWIYDHSITRYDRDLSLGYFDCTNFYYDISCPDSDVLDDQGNIIEKKYRKRGPEKNQRPDPIVSMGLLMDGSCIPVAYDLFPGNESEKVNMLPIVKRAKTDYGFQRIIIVADRGLNTSDNIYKLNGDNKADDNKLDGYIYGQSVRAADKQFKEWVLKQDDYIDTPLDTDDNDDDSNGIFRHKSRIYPKEISVDYENKDKKMVKRKITIDQKQLVYYSPKYALRQKKQRDQMVERAADLIKHPKKYDRLSAKGASGYVLNINFDRQTGEVIDKNLILDEEKIREEELYDGYYSIVTSELDMPDMELRKKYRGLIDIEDSFRISKTCFKSRPIYVYTNDHIDSHFLSCYTALVLIRLLEYRLKYKYPVEQIVESLRRLLKY